MKFRSGLMVFSLALAGYGASPSSADTVSQREYKRGYADCMKGHYDEYQHGASYKRGCRAAEGSGKARGQTPETTASANKSMMKSICDGAVTGKFNPHARAIHVTNVESQNFGWGVYGNVVLDDGSTSDFVCMFSVAGKFKRVNASEPSGASMEDDHEGFCPPDVSEAERYKYPGCN